ncbi:MAG: hypothetical protein H6767_01955 [Candidatus Peribacteria bacterium]|nr:MAG: hypothetical protein H6767_01955 [Candidatus Peribacteria bacterium]
MFNLMCLIYLFEKERKEKGDEYFTKRFLEIKTALPKIKIDARKDTYLSKEKKENENIESELERLMGTL